MSKSRCSLMMLKCIMKIINDADLVQLQCALNSLAEWARKVK